jgi:uncharacterized protein
MVSRQRMCRVPARLSDVHSRRGAGLLASLVALALALLLPLAPVLALSVADLPATPPAAHLTDSADVFSRASRAELGRQLEGLNGDRVNAQLVTVDHLDYGLDLAGLGDQLLNRWSAATPDGPPLLLLLIDAQNKATAILGSPELERQLPATLLRSTARTTMAQPLRDGDRYRQGSLDALQRLRTVLEGGEDAGEPVIPETVVAASNVPTQEETQQSNALTWIVVLLVLGSVVPMLTWWVFSR